MTTKSVILILGFSGVGKTTLCRFAKDHRSFFWIDIDNPSDGSISEQHYLYPSENGLTLNYLKSLRDFLNESDYAGALISMTSNVIIDEPVASLLEAHGTSVVYLYAREKFCLEEFLKREIASDSNINFNYWAKNNFKLSFFLKKHLGEFEKKRSIKIISVTDNLDRRISVDVLFDFLLKKVVSSQK